MKCIRCTREIKSYTLDVDQEEPYYRGIVIDIIPGYGSKFDDEKLSLGICDDCIHEGLVNNLIKYGDQKK